MVKKIDPKDLLKKFKDRRDPYNEQKHCKLLIEVMTDPMRGTWGAFAIEVGITEKTFWNWTRKYEIFGDLYSFCKIYARELWEEEGRQIREMRLPIGTITYDFEYWKLIGWSRFGVSKNSRIKLNLDPNDTPEKHYSQLLKQASEGDFTAAEIKQLMEAVNVGLNTHQVFTLQKQIDDLNSDVSTIKANTDAHNTGANKGITQKD